MGQLKDRVEAANELASLARDNNRNMKIIVQEGGVAPLLKLLKDGASAEAQMAAATALYNLGTDQEKVKSIASEVSALSIVVKAIGESPMRVQIVLVNLVARMAELDEGVREDLGRENVTRPLVTLLGMDIVVEETKTPSGKPTSIHSLVQINKEVSKKNFHSTSSLSLYSDGSSRGGRKEREAESPDMKHRLKISCAGALVKLSKGSLFNSRKITETKALVCLAKLIEKEHGELQLNCLMTVMELAAVAELYPDLRQVAFKPNSPAARVILDQLLRVINEENSPQLLIPTIKSIGSLARTFPAKETRILGPLVTQLGHKSADVATEAAIALGKFVALENFNCVEHSKAIIEANGVPRLMNLLKSNDRPRKHEFILLCCLAIHVGNSPALEQARALSVIEGAARSMLAHHPELRELCAKAVDQLTLYQAGAHTHHKHSYVP
ncbi:Armadillo repeat only 4 [Heracleum sosnowskyi]|uniref:Armadillo repeat only 4 n=1 Tax=Heracleum sosnowskyi TaxID=360622 RepID=A0AAD8H917_9APIA|nr:Armadillo repeat only 4 [Heracleum sosnowskyi]